MLPQNLEWTEFVEFIFAQQSFLCSSTCMCHLIYLLYCPVLQQGSSFFFEETFMTGLRSPPSTGTSADCIAFTLCIVFCSQARWTWVMLVYDIANMHKIPALQWSSDRSSWPERKGSVVDCLLAVLSTIQAHCQNWTEYDHRSSYCSCNAMINFYPFLYVILLFVREMYEKGLIIILTSVFNPVWYFWW